MCVAGVETASRRRECLVRRKTGLPSSVATGRRRGRGPRAAQAFGARRFCYCRVERCFLVVRLPRSAWLSGGSQVFARKNYGRLSDAISAPLSLVLSASWRRMQGKTWLTGSSKTRGGHKCKQFLALTQIKRVRQNFATPTSTKRSSETQRTALRLRVLEPGFAR